jgi:hypothetical protein
MRRIVLAFIIAVIALTTTACGSEDAETAGADGGNATGVQDPGLDVCSLVSDKTVKTLQATSEDPQGQPAETLMENAETFVECLIISGVEVGYAVRAAPGGPELESLLDDDRGFPPEPLAGVGDEAMIGTNSYDGVRITARVGDLELVVDSNAYVDDDDGGISRDDIIALATEVASNLGTEKPGAIRLPKECPSTDASQIRKFVGQTVLARGRAASNGSVTCTYLGAERKVRLAAVLGDRTMRLMSLADSSDEMRLEVDGNEALYDQRDGIVVYADQDCVLAASAVPVAWGFADQGSEEDRRAETIALVKYVDKSMGCPQR